MAATMASIKLELIEEAAIAAETRDHMRQRRVADCVVTYNRIQGEIQDLKKAVDRIGAPIINVTT